MRDGRRHPPGGCCAPGRDAPPGSAPAPAPETAVLSAGPDRLPHAMTRIEGGAFLMGSDDSMAYAADAESPARMVEVAPFSIARHAVSNADFSRFTASGFVTEAERFGWSFVFAGLLPHDFPPTQGVAGAPWWRRVDGADWRHPEGPGSGIATRSAHPVLHASWNDAVAYCAWAGGRLPTEAEWEFAARAGLEGRTFPWGDEREPGGEHRMNVWQGHFPGHNACADGFYGTCPVDAFPPNAHGLFNMTGNVWEWVADARHPGDGATRVQKGGSYLCHASYCRRYRCAARMGSGADSSTGNAGFRCARSAA